MTYTKNVRTYTIFALHLHLVSNLNAKQSILLNKDEIRWSWIGGQDREREKEVIRSIE
jgi:hypothetical protein